MSYDADSYQQLTQRDVRYSFALVTAPAIEPLTIDDVKAYRRSTNNSEDQTVIQPLIKAVRQEVEKRLSRQLITATWDLRFDAFPNQIYGDQSGDYWQFGSLLIGKCPVQSVTSVKYVDTAGVEQTMPTADYVVDVNDEPARITPAFGKTWPTARRQPNAVTVRFVAGYGTTAESVPENLRQWMRLAVGTLDENRELDGPLTLKRLPCADSLLESESWGDYP